MANIIFIDSSAFVTEKKHQQGEWGNGKIEFGEEEGKASFLMKLHKLRAILCTIYLFPKNIQFLCKIYTFSIFPIPNNFIYFSFNIAVSFSFIGTALDNFCWFRVMPEGRAMDWRFSFSKERVLISGFL